jgi:hypothetical protein
MKHKMGRIMPGFGHLTAKNGPADDKIVKNNP